jgi:hypothetical protein
MAPFQQGGSRSNAALAAAHPPSSRTTSALPQQDHYGKGLGITQGKSHLHSDIVSRALGELDTPDLQDIAIIIKLLLIDAGSLRRTDYHHDHH